MTFVTASLAVAGVLAAAIPVIIHLLSRQRRKPVEWAAMRFLLEAMRKHRRRLRAEQIILLAVRCLIVVLFGAALARPLLTQAGLLDRGGERVVYLLVDNGLVSGVTDETGRSALEEHVQQGIDIVRSLQPGDRVGIATAARPAQLILSPPSADHGSVMRLLESLRPSDSPTDLAGAFRALRPTLEDHGAERTNTFVYLLSELRTGSVALESPLPNVLRDLGDHVTLLTSEPARRPVMNVQIASVEPVRHVIVPGAADGSGQVTVHLERHGGELGRDATRVRLAGEALGRVEPRTVRWEPGQSRTTVDFIVNYAPRTPASTGSGSEGASGAREVVVTAHLDDDALNADNVRHSVLELREQLRVALLDRRSFGFEPTIEGFQSGQWIRRALEPAASSSGTEGGAIQVSEIEPAAVSAADVRTVDVVIASRPDLVSSEGWTVLREYVDRGGLLLVVPPGELNVHPWAERFVQAMDLPWRISMEAVSHDPGLPLAIEQPHSALLHMISSELEQLVRPVFAYRTLPIEGEAMEPLLVFSDQSPLLVAAAPGRRAARSDNRAGENDAERDWLGPSQTSRGLVLYMASTPQLDWTNLPGKPLMVPLMQEVVRQGLSSVRARHRIVAGEQPALWGRVAARELVDVRREHRITLDEAGRPQQPLDRAGVYEMRDVAGQRISSVAVNVDPRAGRTDTIAAAAALSWLGGSGAWSMFDRNEPAAALHTAEGGSPIAWLLLWFVLAFVAIETVLQRWFSHAKREGEREFGGLRRGLRATLRRTGIARNAATAGGAA